MAGKRTYRDPCGVARALDVVGERWALLVVRELLLGPKRFTDLRAGLPELGPDVLSQRLRELEARAIVRRQTLPPPAASRVYALTDWGKELEPVVLALGRWGSRAPFPAEHAELSVDAFVVALRTLFDPAHDGNLSAVFELRLDGQSFRIVVADGTMELTREHAGAATADAMIDTDTATLGAILWHGKSLAGELRRKSITLRGSVEAVSRLFALFPAPVPVTTPAAAASAA
jgi:DNA-binding HxlR family transcriptional regulator